MVDVIDNGVYKLTSSLTSATLKQFVGTPFYLFLVSIQITLFFEPCTLIMYTEH